MLDKLAKRLLQPVNTSVISIMGAFNTLLGVWLIMPFTSLNEYSERLELLIGGILLVIGAFILFGALRERLATLCTGALAGFLFWIMGTGLALTNWKSTGWIFTLMIAVYHGFVGLNLLVNSRNLPNKK